MAVSTVVNFLTFVIEEVGIFAVGATVVGWVARDLISQHFDKELSRHEAELEKDKLRFSELHTQRAEITAELYERLVEFEEDMRVIASPMDRPGDPSKEDQFRNVAESGNAFRDYYNRKRIYFSPEVCETIEDLQSELRSAFIEFKVYQPHIDEPMNPVDTDKWLDNWERVSEDEVPEIKTELEDHFRDLLGVEFRRENTLPQETETETETAKE